MKKLGDVVDEELDELLARLGETIAAHRCSVCSAPAPDLLPGGLCHKCHDLAERRRRVTEAMSQLPLAYRFRKVSDVENVGNMIPVKLALDEAAKARRGVYLFGGVGGGKTLLSATHFGRFVWNGVPARWIRMIDLLGSIRHAYAPGSQKSDTDVISALAYFAASGVLIIDDFGAERVTEWAEEKVYDLVDRISGARGCLWLTTNHTPDEMASIIGARVVDRLVGMCQPVHLKAPSYRLRGVGSSG